MTTAMSNDELSGNVNQAKNFSLSMKTDCEQIDFPQSSISPTLKTPGDKRGS